MLPPLIEIRRHSPALPWTYSALDRRQRELACALAAREDAPGALLLSEVAPVITVGRRTPDSDLLLAPDALARRGIEVARVDRGGLATSHGPGQWVVFAVDRLERLTGDRRGVRRAVEGLLAVAREVGRRAGAPEAEIRDGAETGVWSARGKFAAVGVHVERGVLLHGLAINGYRSPTSFAGLRPCGLEPRVAYLLEDADKGAVADAVAADVAPREERFRALGDLIREVALGILWREERALAVKPRASATASTARSTA